MENTNITHFSAARALQAQHTMPRALAQKRKGAKCMQSGKMIPALAMARVDWQMWEGTLSPADALSRGTAFAALDMPFLGKEARA